jgi:Tol biopolymer transport system component
MRDFRGYKKVGNPLLVITLVATLIFSASLALLSTESAYAQFPGANGLIAFISTRDGNREIFTMNPDGSDERQLTFTTTDTVNLMPDWSPDGELIAFVSDRDDNQEIWIMNADGSGQTQLTFTTGVENRHPAWSPDGTKIAFASDRDTDYEIYVMNIDGTGLQQLTDNDIRDNQPEWSPDGSKIAFVKKDLEIWVMNADGSSEKLLADDFDGLASLHPSWSPDGSMIAFTHQGEIWTMWADGTGKTLITSPDDWNPDWSPDGTMITFASRNRHGGSDGFEVYVVNSDGSSPRRLTSNPELSGPREGNWHPDWQRIPPPVGGVVTPVNKIAILVPYLALVGLVAAVSTVYVIKKRKD